MKVVVRRIFHDYRSVVAPLLVLLAGNLLAFVFVVRPLQIKSEGAAQRAFNAAQDLRAAQSDLNRAKSLVDGTAQADTELAAFYQKVLPLDATEARRMTYASLPALARRTDVRYEARNTTVGDAGQQAGNASATPSSSPQQPRLGRMTIRMVLQGEYRNIRRFIHELETAPEFIIIDNVTLTESKSDEPQMLTITLSTYYRPEGNGP